MKTTLLIARHGNTFGPGDIVRRVGLTDLPLVQSGLEQGSRLGTYLKEQDLIPEVIFSSQLKRAIQTAEQAQKQMGTALAIQPLAIFNEIDYGPDENQPEEAVVARVGKEALAAWEHNAVVPQGWKVDPEAVIGNWEGFSQQILKEYSGKRILVVTSNGVARFAPYLTGDFEGFAEKHKIKMGTGAFGIFERLREAQYWHCREWNVKP